MRIHAAFPFVDEAVTVSIEISDEEALARSGHTCWECPLCRMALAREGQTLEVGWISVMELIEFLYLPLRRNEWANFSTSEFGHCVQTLHVGDFLPEQGSKLHEIKLRLGGLGPELRIAFSESQAENWAVGLWDINQRLESFRKACFGR